MPSERARLLASASARDADVEPGRGGDADAAAPRARESWTRARAMVLAVASVTVVLVASLGLASKARLTFGAVSMRAVYGSTLQQLRWTPSEGFERVGGRRRAPSRSLSAARLLELSIARYYPKRLAKNSKPFTVNFITDDCPHTRCKSPVTRRFCHVDAWEPIFAFGSSPKDRTIFPSMHSATLLALHTCFDPEQTIGNKSFVVTKEMEPTCRFLRYPTSVDSMPDCDANSRGHGSSSNCRYYGLFNAAIMPNKDEYEWDNLISRAIWRGSDYPFLSDGLSVWPGGAQSGEGMARALARSVGRPAELRERMESLLKSRHLGPRQRAVLMSKLHPEILDAKFFNWGTRSGRRDGLDLVDSTHIELDAFARYKYQLDLGGGGGTTWSGTLPKLSMPGVLLHHETMMKDSYFDLLTPYEHYLPLKTDLSNLEELMRWVESNPTKAQTISRNAAEWVREFRKPANLLRHNYETVVKPLAKVLDPTGKLKPIPFEVAHPGL